VTSPDGYTAMNEREAIEVMIKFGGRRMVEPCGRRMSANAEKHAKYHHYFHTDLETPQTVP